MDDEKNFDSFIFGVSAVLIVFFVLWSIIFPVNMENVINMVFEWMTTSWSWLWLLTVFLLVVGAFVLLVTDYGKMKLGLPDSNGSQQRYDHVFLPLGPQCIGDLRHAYHSSCPRLLYPGTSLPVFQRVLLRPW